MLKHVLALAFLAACIDGEVVDGVPVVSHSNDDPWKELDKITREGPPRYTSRLHGCPKMRYTTLGNVLVSRGVGATGAAGTMYGSAASSLGAPNYAARVREN